MQSLNTLESLSLTADELGIVEVVDAHCLAYLCHSLGSCLAGFLGALAQDVVDFGNVLLKFVATLAHRFEHVVEDGVEELLASAVAYTSVNVVLLEFVKVLELRPVVGEVVIATECLKIGENGIALKVARLVHRHAWSTVGHLLHLLPYLLFRVAEVDAVAKTLTHLLLAVGSGESAGGGVLGQHDLGLNKHG